MSDAPPSMHTLLSRVLERLPGVRRAVDAHGREALSAHAASLRRPGPEGLQSPLDLTERAHARVERLLGRTRADALAQALESTRSALTANHHGLDTLAQSAQGVLAYATGSHAHGPDSTGKHSHCSVLACGMVPLASFSYPRGLAQARTDPDTGAALRIPIFPAGLRPTLVHAAPPLTPDMARRALAKVRDLARRGLVTDAEARFLVDFLERDCQDPAVSALPRYADQATVLQARLLDRLLPQGPGVTVLELEDLVSDLLRHDLPRDGLAAIICLDKRMRGLVLDALDGVEGCWDASLLDRLARDGGGTGERAGAGTALFWGLDAKGRRVPMACTKRGGKAVLEGQALASDGDRAERLTVPLEAGALMDAMDKGRLAPGLFLSYAVIGFARGLRCCGGVFQSDYMRAMRHGLGQALNAAGAESEDRTVEAVAVDNFIAGPEVAFVRDHEAVRPAGLVELAAVGGVGREALRRAGSLTLEQALLAGLADLVEEFVPQDERPEGWRHDVAVWLQATPEVVLV